MRVVKIDKARLGERVEVPLVTDGVAAGFPSPSEGYVQGSLDLEAYLVENPEATFFVQVVGEAVQGARVQPGDLLVVDCSLAPMDRDMVIAELNGAWFAKRFRCQGGQDFLEAEGSGPVQLEATEGTVFEVWGVVTRVIHAM